MRAGSSNAAERAYYAAGGGGNRTPVSARTPRRDPGSSNAVVHASGGHVRALQDPGLKDYVCVLGLSRSCPLSLSARPRPVCLALRAPTRGLP